MSHHAWPPSVFYDFTSSPSSHLCRLNVQVWAHYEEQPVEEVMPVLEEKERSASYKPVFVTEITDDLHFYVQDVETGECSGRWLVVPGLVQLALSGGRGPLPSGWEEQCVGSPGASPEELTLPPLSPCLVPLLLWAWSYFRSLHMSPGLGLGVEVLPDRSSGRR